MFVGSLTPNMRQSSRRAIFTLLVLLDAAVQRGSTIEIHASTIEIIVDVLQRAGELKIQHLKFIPTVSKESIKEITSSRCFYFFGNSADFHSLTIVGHQENISSLELENFKTRQNGIIFLSQNTNDSIRYKINLRHATFVFLQNMKFFVFLEKM